MADGRTDGVPGSLAVDAEASVHAYSYQAAQEAFGCTAVLVVTEVVDKHTVQMAVVDTAVGAFEHDAEEERDASFQHGDVAGVGTAGEVAGHLVGARMHVALRSQTEDIDGGEEPASASSRENIRQGIHFIPRC